jgi:hypothetical protein
MYYTTIERCFIIEASGMHRLEALTRQAVGHGPPLACTVGPHGSLKEASTCRIEAGFDVPFQDPCGHVFPEEYSVALGYSVGTTAFFPKPI